MLTNFKLHLDALPEKQRQKAKAMYASLTPECQGLANDFPPGWTVTYDLRDHYVCGWARCAISDIGCLLWITPTFPPDDFLGALRDKVAVHPAHVSQARLVRVASEEE